MTLPAAITPDEAQTKSQHGLAALLTAAGASEKAICAQLGMKRKKYRLFLQSGVFNALVADYRKRLLERTLDDASTNLLADASHNIRFLQDVRDGKLDSVDSPVLSNRLRASHLLLDKQFPKTQDGGPNTHLIADSLRKIANAVCVEVGEPVEIEATPLDEKLKALE